MDKDEILGSKSAPQAILSGQIQSNHFSGKQISWSDQNRRRMRTAIAFSFILSWNSLGVEAPNPLSDWKLRHEFLPLLPALKSSFQGVAGGSNIWVAVDGEGSIWTSPAPAAVPWSKQDSGNTNFLGIVRFLGGKFVLGGSNGTILSSTDGASWSRFEDGTFSLVKEVAFGNGTFVAVGTGGFAWTSTNAMSWVRQSIPNAKDLSGVVFNGSAFVAIDRSSFPVFTRILSSTNGSAWNVEATHNAALGRVVFHDGLYAAIVTNSGYASLIETEQT